MREYVNYLERSESHWIHIHLQFCIRIDYDSSTAACDSIYLLNQINGCDDCMNLLRILTQFLLLFFSLQKECRREVPALNLNSTRTQREWWIN